MHVLRDRRYVTGMPELAYAGLSEGWLLKECGQRHWRGIAGACGHAVPRFRDTAGRTAYAAFTAISLSDARLDGIAEHDRFHIVSAVAPASRSQWFSRHTVSMGHNEHARLHMLSAFVCRTEAGNNQSVVRAAMTPREAPDHAGSLPDDIDALLQLGTLFRRGQPDCSGMTQGAGGDVREFRFLPCPGSDFNGANFLYFAAFQDIVERAEWSWFRRRDLPALDRRQMVFHGNVNVGDEVLVRLMAHRQADGTLAHWCRVLRSSDGARIADIVTHKRQANGAPR